jgi:NADH-quinone oxidoreductase subunit D
MPVIDKIQYQYSSQNLSNSEPTKFKLKDLKSEEMILNIGPQHPSTHGVLRLEVISDGEYIKEVIPHIGYLHRCFEKHAEALAYNQIIPYVDRLDYVASMNSEHAYVLGVERMLGIEGTFPKRTEYIRVAFCSNRYVCNGYWCVYPFFVGHA